MKVKRKCVTCGNKIKCLSCGDVYEMRNTDIFTGELLLTSECDCGEQLSLCPDCKDGWQEIEIWKICENYHEGEYGVCIYPDCSSTCAGDIVPLPPEQAGEVIMEMREVLEKCYLSLTDGNWGLLVSLEKLLDKYQVRRVGG